jgi:hypothetical protein
MKCSSVVDRKLPLVVDKGEEAHDELTVHAVGHAAVSRDRITEIFNVKSSLESGSEEATKRSDERGEGCKNQNVKLHRSVDNNVSIYTG